MKDIYLISFFVSSTIITAIIFIVIQKRLHVLESIFIWQISSIILTTVCSIICTNLQYIALSDKLLHALIVRLMEIIYFPGIILLFINYIYVVHHMTYRLLLVILSLFFLVGMQYLLYQGKFLNFINWNIYKSVLLWLLILFIISIPHRIFKQKLIKEVGD